MPPIELKFRRPVATPQPTPAPAPSGGFLQGFKDWYDKYSQPYGFLPEDLRATREVEQMNIPQWMKSAQRGITETPYEAMKYLVGNPIGTATTAATLGTGRFVPPALRLGASAIDFLGSAAGMGRGAIDVAENLPEGNYGRAALGTTATLLGALGARGAVNRMRGPELPLPAPAVAEPPPPTIIPGKRRLGPAPQPYGLLTEGTPPPVGPVTPPVAAPPAIAPPAGPRFIAGQAGIAEAGQTYPAYLPQSDLNFAQSAGRIENLLDEPSPGRIPAETAANIGVGPAPVATNQVTMNLQHRKAIYDQLVAPRWQGGQGLDPVSADKLATEMADTMVVKPPVQRVGMEQTQLPPEYSTPPDWYSGPGTALPGSPAIPGVRTPRAYSVQYGPEPPPPSPGPAHPSPPTGPMISITNPEMKGAQRILRNRPTPTTPAAQGVAAPPGAQLQTGTTGAPAPKPIGWARRLGKGMGIAIETELEKMGPAGVKLNQLLGRASMYTRQRAARWEEPFVQIGKILKTPEQQAALFDAIEKGAVPTDPKIVQAMNILRSSGVDTDAAKEMVRIGLLDPKTKKPVQPLQNYAPHVRPEGETPAQLAAALRQKFPRMDEATALKVAEGKIGKGKGVVDSLMTRLGVDRETAMLIRDMGRRKGERTITSQFSRRMNLPGYRKDLDVFKEHYYELAKKLSDQEVLGRLDTADPKGELSRLIEQTPNPQYTRELLDAQLDRVVHNNPTTANAMNRLNEFATKAMSRMFLSLFPIANTANTMTIPMVTSLKATRRAVMEAMSDPAAARHIASESGALYNVTKGILEAGDMYGIKRSENFNRILAAGAGRAFVADLFEGLRAGKLSAKETAKLAKFTDTPLDQLAKQKKLTEQQLRNAGFKVSELTQGLSEARKIPELWSNPYLKTIFIFKKMAFQQTKILKDSIKEDPLRNGLIWLAASQVLGEGIADTKALLKGTVRGVAEGDIQGGLEKEWSDRTAPTARLLPEGLAESPVARRLVDNMLQSWALGLVADLLYASTGEAETLGALAGSGVGTAAQGIDQFLFKPARAAYRGVSGDIEGAKTALTPAARTVTRSIPWFGQGLQKAWFPTQQQSRTAKNP